MEVRMRGRRLLIANKIAQRMWKIYRNDKYFRDATWREVRIVLGKYRKTKVYCSDPMCCGNPRRIGRLPIRELKQYEDFTDQTSDV